MHQANRSGFSFIEIILTVGLMVVIGVITIPLAMNYYQKVYLKNISHKFVANYQKARANSSGDSPWAIVVESDKYAVYPDINAENLADLPEAESVVNLPNGTSFDMNIKIKGNDAENKNKLIYSFDANGNLIVWYDDGGVGFVQDKDISNAALILNSDSRKVGFKMSFLGSNIEFCSDCESGSTALTTVCGDGIISGEEICDDWNAVSGDGCSDVCAPEDGWICDGEPSVCEQQAAPKTKITWAKKYKVPAGSGLDTVIHKTTDGGYVFGGYYNYIYKIDENGEIEDGKCGDSQKCWVREYIPNKNYYTIYFKDLTQTNDGGYIMGGSSKYCTSGRRDFNIFKTNEKGEIKWVKRYGTNVNDEFQKLQQTPSGGYILSGHGFDNKDKFFLIKTDSDGKKSWAKKIEIEQSFYSLKEIEFLEIVNDSKDINGYNYIFGKYQVIKTDSEGNIKWAKFYKFYEKKDEKKIEIRSAQEVDGGYLLGGGTIRSDKSFILLKIDENGGIEWGRKYSDNQIDQSYILKFAKKLNNGEYILGGDVKYYGGYNNNKRREKFFVIKTKNDGDLEWAKTYGYEEEGQHLNSFYDTEKGYIFAGEKAAEFFLVKTDLDGELTCGTTKIAEDIKDSVVYSSIDIDVDDIDDKKMSVTDVSDDVNEGECEENVSNDILSKVEVTDICAD